MRLKLTSLRDWQIVVGFFLIWRLSLVLILEYGSRYFPFGFTDRFLGGGINNYVRFPQVFAWANFDGEHYLSIAFMGYSNLQQAFFPMYPILIRFFSWPFLVDFSNHYLIGAIIGQIISNISLLGGLLLLFKLIQIDYPKEIAVLTVGLLLLFPTSFFFAGVYTESLFLLLSVASFYLARQGKWWWAGVVGMAASATRVFGVLLWPALLLEAWQQKVGLKRSVGLFLVPVGLLAYMVYLGLSTGDPIRFYSLQSAIGEQHQTGLILLPQVFFRYFKILLTTSIGNPIYQTVFLELSVAILMVFLCSLVFSKKMRWSYIFYGVVSFLAPTIQGSFSSTPRYVLVIFPCFVALALFFSKLSVLIRLLTICLLVTWLIGECLYFLRGFWIA